MPGTVAARALPHNCTLSASGYGTYAVDAVRIQHGMGIVSSEDQSRNGAAFYPTKRTSGSFGMTVEFADHSEFEKFNTWIENYCRRIANPETTGVGQMRVQCPAVEFDKIAIISGERGPATTHGDDWNAVKYAVTLNFEGARDSLALTSPLLSEFRRPSDAWDGVNGSTNFYPSGKQQEGEEAWDLSSLDWSSRSIVEGAISESQTSMLTGGLSGEKDGLALGGSLDSAIANHESQTPSGGPGRVAPPTQQQLDDGWVPPVTGYYP
jgi:hypothetical protein